jgi:hypothetical protein
MSTALPGNERGGHRLHRNPTTVNYTGSTAAVRRTQELPDHRAEIAVVAGRPPFRPLADSARAPVRLPPRSSRPRQSALSQPPRRSSATTSSTGGPPPAPADSLNHMYHRPAVTTFPFTHSQYGGQRFFGDRYLSWLPAS